MGVHFFEVYSDIGAGKHGTTEGVAMLSSHCHDTYPQVTKSEIHPKNRISEFAHPHGKYIEQLTPFFEEILLPTLQEGLKTCDKEGKFPIIISGDHSNAMGNVSAFLNHHQDKKTAIVWIDAHADLHSVYTTPSGNLHGMPLGAVLGLDNKDCQINELDATTHDYWQRLKNLTANKPSPNNVYFLGLRSFEPPETHLLDTHKMFAYSSEAHRTTGIDELLSELVGKLQGFDAVYVSFDVDALDESLIPATGTPEPKGYNTQEIKTIFDKLLNLPNVKLFEITEFNPTLDSDGDKHKTIFEVLDYAIDLLDKR